MKYIYLFTLLVFLASCKSPSELLNNGNYDQAFKAALTEIKKGKNVDQNSEVIQKSSNYMVSKALNSSNKKSRSKDVDDWIDAQTDLYQVLENVGEANVLLEGLINEQYDDLCSDKKDIDFKIVEYYYNEGHDFLNKFGANGEKVDARNAYYSFKKCDKYEGSTYFLDLDEDIDTAYRNGIVYYISNSQYITPTLFLKPLPKGSEMEEDCNISVDHGLVSYSTSEKTQKDRESAEIEVGKKEIVDTSGMVTYEPIFENVEATVISKKITVTASVTTSLWSRNVTGQCNVFSKNFTTTLEDTYEEISVTGDQRALVHHIFTKSGEPGLLRSTLKDDVLKKATRAIGL